MSGRKQVLTPFKIIDAVSMGASFTTDPVNIQFLDNVSIQLAWASADAVGTFEIECSNDCKVDGNGAYVSGTFYALTFSPSLAQPSSDSQGYLIEINQSPHAWLRIKYTRSSGTGTANATIAAKAV